MSNTIEKVLKDQEVFLARALERAQADDDRNQARVKEARTAARDSAELVTSIRAALQQVRRDLETGRLN